MRERLCSVALDGAGQRRGRQPERDSAQAAIPANVGVNPSLTITALAEHAMSQVPAAATQDSARMAA